MSIISMLADPNISSPANIDASKEWRDKPKEFKAHVAKLVDRSKLALPSDFEMPKPKKPVKQPEIDEFLDDNWDTYSDEMLEDPEEEEEEEDEDQEVSERGKMSKQRCYSSDIVSFHDQQEAVDEEED
jgi:ubiquitin-conjugating enzyme E2 R